MTARMWSNWNFLLTVRMKSHIITLGEQIFQFLFFFFHFPFFDNIQLGFIVAFFFKQNEFGCLSPTPLTCPPSTLCTLLSPVTFSTSMSYVTFYLQPPFPVPFVSSYGFLSHFIAFTTLIIPYLHKINIPTCNTHKTEVICLLF